MDRQIRIERKLEELLKLRNKDSQTLAVNTKLLDEHIKRTNLLEAKIEHIEEHVYNVKGAAKLIVIVGIIIGAVTAIYNTIGG
jgi:hypothetical protein